MDHIQVRQDKTAVLRQPVKPVHLVILKITAYFSQKAF